MSKIKTQLTAITEKLDSSKDQTSKSINFEPELEFEENKDKCDVDGLDFVVMPHKERERGYSVFFKQPSLQIQRRPTYISANAESEFDKETENDFPQRILSNDEINMNANNPF